ncbi:GNAT family N-acetyltransferase [Hamadaea tsunoensis]|uniref:GNAT family N-acetyltransferase n=1 Tax=Hamadaea tsunoensis TaxID=53368 RepID=UPI000481F7A1|nr:GNAT family protein [Hamadaea tsunoensis]
MLRGEKTALRARHESDIPVLQAELHDDVETRSRADSRPWRPIPPDSPHSPYRLREPSDDVVIFSAVALAPLHHPGAQPSLEARDQPELVGEALLWAVDLHNRLAHIGISLRPAYRGRGLGTDIVRTLCDYGFRIRGLHRLQIETLADNRAMITAAERNGFRHEGTLRQPAWVAGAFADEVIYGLLAPEWEARRVD